jgi:hypothetical protein
VLHDHELAANNLHRSCVRSVRASQAPKRGNETRRRGAAATRLRMRSIDLSMDA